MFTREFLTVQKFCAAFALAALIVATFGSGSAVAGGNEIRMEADLIAVAAAGDVSGKADFRDKRNRRKFSVEIEGFAPGTMLDVEVAGVIVGTVVVDGFGIGDFNLDDRANPNDQDLPFPANFPNLTGGERVEVGPIVRKPSTGVEGIPSARGGRRSESPSPLYPLQNYNKFRESPIGH